jgi:hypothetical protein
MMAMIVVEAPTTIDWWVGDWAIVRCGVVIVTAARTVICGAVRRAISISAISAISTVPVSISMMAIAAGQGWV